MQRTKVFVLIRSDQVRDMWKILAPDAHMHHIEPQNKCGPLHDASWLEIKRIAVNMQCTDELMQTTEKALNLPNIDRMYVCVGQIWWRLWGSSSN